jgi:plasmid stability protein
VAALLFLHRHDACFDAEGGGMKAVTLRNLPALLDRTIRQRAKKKGVSVNKVVISLLQDHLGESEARPVRRYHDLDGLAGSWTKQEAEAFEKTLAQQRTPDPGIWK